MYTSKRTKFYRGTPGEIAQLARALRRGELVAVPTETVYGLAGDALNPRACRAIFEAKGRPSNDPLIVHVHELEQLDELAVVGPETLLLAGAFWPGPLTLVLPKKPAVPDLVTSGLPSVAVRMPRHPLFRKLLKACGRPLAAPSANPFGYISPTSAEHVADGLGGKIQHILDGGPCRIGLESTILDLRTPSRPVILRPGAIERKDLEAVLGRRVTKLSSKEGSKTIGAAVAPGLLTKHYSPRTPLELHRRISRAAAESFPAGDVVLFIFRPAWTVDQRLADRVVWLADADADPEGALGRAARGLFAQLRRLDSGGWKRIHAVLVPGSSALALAINDRLQRAAAKR